MQSTAIFEISICSFGTTIEFTRSMPTATCTTASSHGITDHCNQRPVISYQYYRWSVGNDITAVHRAGWAKGQHAPGMPRYASISSYTSEYGTESTSPTLHCPGGGKCNGFNDLETEPILFSSGFVPTGEYTTHSPGVSSPAQWSKPGLVTIMRQPSVDPDNDHHLNGRTSSLNDPNFHKMSLNRNNNINSINSICTNESTASTVIATATSASTTSITSKTSTSSTLTKSEKSSKSTKTTDS